MAFLFSLVLIAGGTGYWPRFQTNRAHLALLREPGALPAASISPASPSASAAPSISLLATSIQASDLLLASRLLMAAGRRPEAESILNNLERDPVTGDLLAQLHVAKRNWDAALELWRDLEAPSRLVLLGDLTIPTEPERAIAAYRAALECRIPYEAAYYRLGWADYRLRRDTCAAEKIFRRAFLDCPDSPWPAVNIADLLMETGRTSSAVAWYEKALEIAPAEAGLPEKLAWARLAERGKEASK